MCVLFSTLSVWRKNKEKEITKECREKQKKQMREFLNK
jgi:hypothetical protein